ncbi:Hypothetical predicted protein [Pelobates cultripes]|uniref:Uncharacterized protein n=1 Tax=Pelobates cultripes TaxID=61616 RepID=A0AAD1VLC4_PELCU|nr:Hypothetical predicted protein [Pelobates cultripes]
MSRWKVRGESRVQDILEGGKIKQFPILQRELQLPARDIFLYLRIKNIVHSHIQLCTTHSSKPHLTLKQALFHKQIKPLSACYNALVTSVAPDKPTYMNLWEEDIGLQISKTEWLMALETTKKASQSLTLWEAYCKFKVIKLNETWTACQTRITGSTPTHTEPTQKGHESHHNQKSPK